MTKEHEELKGTWNQLEMKWMQLQTSRQRYDIRAREALLLERMHERLVFCINEARLKKVNNFSGMLQWIDDHVTELLYTTRKDFRHELTVSSHVIAKVDISFTYFYARIFLPLLTILHDTLGDWLFITY